MPAIRGKVEGGDLSVLEHGGSRRSDPSLRPQGGRKPPAPWNPRPLRAFPPPPPVSIEVAARRMVPVSSESSLQPSPRRAQGRRSRRFGGLGGQRADSEQDGAGAQRRGWGGGEAADHPALSGTGTNLLGDDDLGGLEGGTRGRRGESCSFWCQVVSFQLFLFSQHFSHLKCPPCKAKWPPPTLRRWSRGLATNRATHTFSPPSARPPVAGGRREEGSAPRG